MVCAPRASSPLPRAGTFGSNLFYLLFALLCDFRGAEAPSHCSPFARLPFSSTHRWRRNLCARRAAFHFNAMRRLLILASRCPAPHSPLPSRAHLHAVSLTSCLSLSLSPCRSVSSEPGSVASTLSADDSLSEKNFAMQ